MANVYVWSGASGSANGNSWANAHTTLTTAVTGKAAGDVFWIAHDHAESTAASITVTFPGTEINPNRIYCVSRAGSVPPVLADLLTTATVTTTGNNTITLAGSIAECYGITFISGSSGTSAGSIFLGPLNRTQRFVACVMRLATTATTARVTTNNGQGSLTIFENTTVRFANAAQRVAASRLIWKDTANVLAASSTVPAYLLSASTGYILLEGVGLTSITTGLVESVLGSTAHVTFKDCSLASAVPVTNSLSSGSTATLEVYIVRSDSGDSNWRIERHGFAGVVSTETTIVRTGGATDGTTPVSWKLVTNGNPEWEFPLEAMPISFWNENIGSPIVVALQGIWGGGAVPNNDEIWIEVEYLGNSGTSRGSRVTSGKAHGLSSAIAIPAGSGTWGGSTTKFAMIATFTPQEKGPVSIYVRAARLNATFYVDPKPLIT